MTGNIIIFTERVSILIDLFDLDKKDYFKLTFEYIELKQVFLVDDFMNQTMLLIDMIIQPMYIFYKKHFNNFLISKSVVWILIKFLMVLYGFIPLV